MELRQEQWHEGTVVRTGGNTSALVKTSDATSEARRQRHPRVPVREANGWARGLGWFSLGLGAAELLAPSPLARLIGVADSTRSRGILRALGAREVAAALGLLVPRRPGRWLWSRVAGDVVDLALLGAALTKGRKTRTNRASLALVAVAGVTAIDVWASLRRQDPSHARSGTPGTSSDGSVRVRAVVTIQRPAAEIYRLWRDFKNLPRFLSHVRSVEVRDELRSRWHVSVTGRDDLQWDALITSDRPDELIAWRSTEDAPFDHAGEVRFVQAPGGRGTEVHLEMDVLVPGGPVGKAVGGLVHRLPEQILAGDLKRLKQLLETGEVMKSDASIHARPHPARPTTQQPEPSTTNASEKRRRA